MPLKHCNPCRCNKPDTPVDYTQLPENLPARIRQLARSITEDQSTIFEQVTAIENHLKNSIEFRYSKTDAVYPAEEQDYVDQFLFESKVGYCDNFSTAMVVLLRTLDIPARWVKGFSPGDAQTENGYRLSRRRTFKILIVPNCKQQLSLLKYYLKRAVLVASLLPAAVVRPAVPQQRRQLLRQQKNTFSHLKHGNGSVLFCKVSHAWFSWDYCIFCAATFSEFASG